MKKRVVSMLLLICLVLGLAGCGEKKQEETPPKQPESTEQTTPTPEPEPEPEPEPYVPAGTNPLTGLPMEPEFEDDRPVAIMFNNIKAAQPQLGVSQADIIYEIPAEGGVTRMLGLFQTLDGVETLGSIRSTRPYYLEAALGHDAILVHAGASPDAYSNIRNWGMANIDGVNGGPSQDEVFWRDAERKKNAGYEHSLLTSGGNILKYLESGKYRTEHQEGYSYQQAFAEDGTPINGTPADHFKLYFTNYKTGVFDYDPETMLYYISQYGSAYKDGNTGEQVGVTNVLILETAISIISGDREGRLNVRMTGTGSGTYFCGGKYVPIQWSKADRNSPFVYTTQDGAPLTLGQGHTYVCIMSPATSTLSFE